jgi:SAM-dependent methyltransferase
MQDATPVTYAAVTEVSGEEVSQEQVDRMIRRYAWASGHCRGKDVIEVACGSGQGLGFLASVAGSVVGGDVSPDLVASARATYDQTIDIRVFDAHQLPFPDRMADVVLLFEAIYYLHAPEVFARECARILRPGGKLLVATANKDLYDFNPSPHSHRYFGAAELPALLEPFGFRCQLFGDTPLESVGLRQRFLRPVKRLAIGLGLMPKTMAGKRLLKRLVFGSMVEMPARLDIPASFQYLPLAIPVGQPDRRHKVIFCEATLESTGFLKEK